MSPARTVLLALIVALWPGGCSDTEKPPEHKAVPISAAEERRGLDACSAYVERLCRCAETRAEFAEPCELVRTARVEALRKALAASRDSTEDEHVRWRTGVTARRIISRCIEEDNKLDVGLCPRKSTGAGAGAGAGAGTAP